MKTIDRKIDRLIEKGYSDTQIIRKLLRENGGKVFEDFLMRKVDFDDAKDEGRGNKLSAEEVNKVRKLLSADHYKELPRSASSFDDLFKEDDPKEMIVYVKDLGYFYVNTEGFSYARYLAYLPINEIKACFK